MKKVSDQVGIRHNKLEKLKKLKIDPYPSICKRTFKIEAVILNFNKYIEEKIGLNIVGRIISLRIHGGSTFANLKDESGQLQLYFKKDVLGNQKYLIFLNLFDIGDIISVTGTLFRTKKGEKTLEVKSFSLLSKSFFPLPEKWHGLTDTEIRYRKRYLDLISNPEVKAIFIKKALIIKYLRKFLEDSEFLEVETPILQPIPGGANARPFSTFHNALKTKFYLRIAPELYLKRLIVGGFEKVYEIARCFRNEGIDYSHNPEFTQVEFYWAYADYNQLMDLVEQMLKFVIENIERKLAITYLKNNLDFTPPYKRITFHDAFLQYTNIDIDQAKSLKELKEKIKSLGLETAGITTAGTVYEEVYKKVIRPKLIQPTFLIDQPVEISPLAKAKADNSKYAQRFQLIVGGLELANAFSELNDPDEQLKRFKDQEKLRKKGDEEAQRIDKDFIEALSYGMPPTAGFGMGIDRLTTLLTNTHNLKEVILFPTLKPKK